MRCKIRNQGNIALSSGVYISPLASDLLTEDHTRACLIEAPRIILQILAVLGVHGVQFARGRRLGKERRDEELYYRGDRAS